MFTTGQGLSRRDFLRLTTMTAAGAIAAACVAPSAAPAGGDGASAPAAEAVKVIATTSMPVNTFDETIKRSKDALAGITLEVNANSFNGGGWDAYSDNLLTRIAGGEQIDVIMIAIEGLGLLAKKNVLVPLDEFLAADTEANDILQNDVHKTLREMLQVDGKQLEYPFSWNNMVTYYNTEIFKAEGIEPPKADWTWDDFLEVCLKIAKVSGGADDRYAYSFWGSGMFGMAPWYFNNDTSPLTKDWSASNLLDPKVAETLQFMADLILKHKVAPNPTGWDEWPQFHAGHVAMRTCGRWCIGGSLKENFTSYDLQFAPHRAGPLKTVVGTDGWGVASASKNAQQAWQVVKLLSGPDASMDMVKLGGNIPALRSVSEKPEFAEFGPPNTKIFYDSLDFAATVPAPTNFNIIDPILNRHYATIWNGEKSVEEALQAAHAELQPEMDKLKNG